MHRISPDKFSALISSYWPVQNSAWILEPVVHQTSGGRTIPQMIRDNIDIQSALCEMLFTESSSIQITIPRSAFRPSEYSAIFHDITLVSGEKNVITCALKGPKPEAMELLTDTRNIKLLHPLLQESVLYYLSHGKIDLTLQTVFYAYPSTLKGARDMFLDRMAPWPSKAYLSMPVYLPQAELEKSDRIKGYGGYFDELVFVGHMSEDSFISHAMVGFFSK